MGCECASAGVTEGVFAVVDEYRGLARAIRDRIISLNISLETAENLAGIPPGYMAKITSDPPLRRASPYTLLLVLQALSLKVTLTHDPQMAERMQHRYEPRKAKRPLARCEKQASPKQASILTPDFLRTRARLGGIGRAARLSEARRADIARAAAQSRWQRIRDQSAHIPKDSCAVRTGLL
jgi:hypothetical protein